MCKIIEKLKFAIAVSPNETEKQVNLWKEGIKNLQDAISRKLDYMSFMLLKEAGEYLNPKTDNMEYVALEGDDDHSAITLCLWANLYMAARKQGMDILGFSFRLPMDVVLDDCAVRLMHTMFDYVSPEIHVTQEALPEPKDTLEDCTSEDIVEDQIELPEGQIEVTEGEISEIGINELNEDIEVENGAQEEDALSVTEGEKPPEEAEIISEEPSALEKEMSSSNVFHPKTLPPLVEPEMEIVDQEEYFIVGGIFYFDLYLVPQQTVRTKKITYIHRERPKLRRIIYKRKIVPPRKLEFDTSYSAAAYEKIRFKKELEDAIFIQLQLPKKVIYLENPEPARLFVEKGGYSKDCIYERSYNKDARQISFKTNQFGIFAMLQKRYENFPYKKWYLTGGKSVLLTIVGRRLEMEIQISNEGYKLKFLNPDDDFIQSEVSSIWMATDLFVEKLESLGINIKRGPNAEKYADIDSKDLDLEDNVYDCIALLSGEYNFKSVKKFSSKTDEITLGYSAENEEKPKIIVIRKYEVIDLETEQKRIAEARAAAEEAEKLNVDTENTEKIALEDNNVEEQVTEKSAEKDNEMQSNGNQKEVVFKDLYHYVMNEMDERQRKSITSTNACLIENVRSLLRICRPLSSM